MPLPNYQEFMEPVLDTLSSRQIMRKRDIVEQAADNAGLTFEQRQEMLDSGRAPVYKSRISWALAYLKQAKAIESPQRAYYTITDRGLDLLSSEIRPINTELLMRFQEFVEFRERAGTNQAPADDADRSESDLTPEEQLNQAYKTIRADIQDQILDQLKSVDPAQFERIVVDVLRAIGYGVDNSESTRITGRPGDEGIDGVIDEDLLGLDSIYIQAKRWQGSVGRPEVQAFTGALQGQNASRGVLITTSEFSSPAKEYVSNLATSRIVLVDGQRLASLMFDHDVGVSCLSAVVTKTIDTDYFSADD